MEVRLQSQLETKKITDAEKQHWRDSLVFRL